MRRDAFIDWLIQSGQLTSTATSRAANCKAVERAYVMDLDTLSPSALAALLEEFEYTKEEQRSGRPVRHKVPIDGNLYDGTATLKSALKLYRDFRIAPDPRPAPIPGHPPSPRKPPSAGWPEWEPPSDDDSLLLARVLARHARFLKPEIVHAVVEDNERRASAWRAALNACGVPVDAYLWEGSPCAFPGVRRYAGSDEIAIFRRRKQGGGNLPPDVLQLDDNDYPKHLWSYVFCGTPFRKQGPPGYNLAHLADHKSHGNRAADEFEVPPGVSVDRRLHGLFTCPTNTAYLPAGLLKPTDFHRKVRGLFLRKAQALYGAFCNLVPPFMSVRTCDDPRWDVDHFDWLEPVGGTVHPSVFLEFRARTMDELLARPRQARSSDE